MAHCIAEGAKEADAEAEVMEPEKFSPAARPNASRKADDPRKPAGCRLLT